MSVSVNINWVESSTFLTNRQFNSSHFIEFASVAYFSEVGKITAPKPRCRCYQREREILNVLSFLKT